MGGDASLQHHDADTGLHRRPSEIEALKRFVAALHMTGFCGEISTQADARLVFSTDNSIYQRIPLAVIFAKESADLNRAVKAASEGSLTLAIRGGGTGTNGQSLTPDIVVDVSRHMTRIVAFDAQARTVTVEPGVILSRLNAFLKPHGLFFPPTVSTATRATIGGMIATDASGKGSRIYGKTSDYIDALDVVLSDGSDLHVRHLTADALAAEMARPDLSGAIHREVHRVVTTQADEIARVFPDMNRGLTGYNLQNVLHEDGSFTLSRLLAGSEGTLALTKQATLRLRPIPAHRTLLVVRYASFDAALRHVRTLLDAEPAAVEVLDDRVLNAARKDVSWVALEGVLGREEGIPVEGLSFVEFVGDSPASVQSAMSRAVEICAGFPKDIIDYKTIFDPDLIGKLWTLREKSVGLLGRPDGRRQGVAFVEDTAVPPENLADYVKEFRSVLDRHGLTYGMFGHADVGCLHVRPFLDMLEPGQRALVRDISDEVAALTQRYGGLLWGEHGRGFRGEFSPLFFGETLFAELCRIKAVFDPADLFNRGKLVSGAGHAVDRIDGVPFKGGYDAVIAPALQQDYGLSISCNGNGACFNREPDMAMCPSYKATGDRRQSPKGRATLLRSWARLRSLPREDPQRQDLGPLTAQLKSALDSCLSCKACASQCPIRVDIPAMRSRFLNTYFETNRRPMRDWLVYWLEPLLGLGRRMPRVANLGVHNPLARRVLATIGIVDLPRFRPARLNRGARITTAWLSGDDRDGRRVVLLQDSYTGSFDGDLVRKSYHFLRGLGYDVRVTPVLDNGKARHVLGFARGFETVARRILREIGAILAHGVPVLSLDAATGLMFDHEYREIISEGAAAKVIPLERFLCSEITAGIIPARADSAEGATRTVLSHCTEQAMAPASASDWVRVLAHFGIRAQAGKTGCCGMAGLFGHQREHQQVSHRLFEQNWADHVSGDLLATGFSCRCQTSRMTHRRPDHPVDILISRLKE